MDRLKDSASHKVIGGLAPREALIVAEDEDGQTDKENSASWFNLQFRV